MATIIDRMPDFMKDQFRSPELHIRGTQDDKQTFMRRALSDNTLFVIRHQQDDEGMYSLWQQVGDNLATRISPAWDSEKNCPYVMRPSDFNDELVAHLQYWKNYRNEAIKRHSIDDKKDQAQRKEETGNEILTLAEDVKRQVSTPNVVGKIFSIPNKIILAH
jgi:hypothetical protein